MKSAHFHSHIGQGLNDMASCPPIHMMRVSKVFLSFSSFFLLSLFFFVLLANSIIPADHGIHVTLLGEQIMIPPETILE